MSLRKPVFINTRGLTEVTGLPVLGAVSAAWTTEREQARRKDRLAYAGAAAGLLVVFVAVVAIQWSSGSMLPSVTG